MCLGFSATDTSSVAVERGVLSRTECLFGLWAGVADNIYFFWASVDADTVAAQSETRKSQVRISWVDQKSEVYTQQKITFKSNQ